MTESELRCKLDGEKLFVLVPTRIPHCFQNVGGTAAASSFCSRLTGPSGSLTSSPRSRRLTRTAFRRIGVPLGMTVIGPPLARPPCSHLKIEFSSGFTWQFDVPKRAKRSAQDVTRALGRRLG